MRRISIGRMVTGVVVWTYALALAIPVYFLLVSAFKDNSAIFNRPFALPTEFDLDNFSAAWDNAKLGPAIVNSIALTVVAEVLTLVLAVPAAYGIARAGGRLGDVIERVFSLGFLIPAFAALVPTLLLSIALGLFHTRQFLAVFLSATTLPLSVVLLAQFMRTIPAELEEAALVDGATRLQILRSVYLPLVVPGISLVVILNFLTFWNEFLFSLVLLGSDAEVRTVQVALPTLVSATDTKYGVLLAGTIITLVPVYLVYLLMHRRVEGALTAGAIKG